MNLKNLVLPQDIVANNGPMVPIEVIPNMEYDKNGLRTDRQIGIKVRVVLPNQHYEQLTVAVSSTVDPVSSAIEKADASHPVHVTFDDFKAKVYVMNGKAGISAKASAVHIVQPPATKDDFDFG